MKYSSYHPMKKKVENLVSQKTLQRGRVTLRWGGKLRYRCLLSLRDFESSNFMFHQ